MRTFFIATLVVFFLAAVSCENNDNNQDQGDLLESPPQERKPDFEQPPQSRRFELRRPWNSLRNFGNRFRNQGMSDNLKGLFENGINVLNRVQKKLNENLESLRQNSNTALTKIPLQLGEFLSSILDKEIQFLQKLLNNNFSASRQVINFQAMISKVATQMGGYFN